MSKTPGLRVAMFPTLKSTNPYRRLIDDALAERGIEVEHGDALNPDWARAARGRVQAIHLHWLEFLFFSGGGTARRQLSMHVQALRVVWALHILRRSGVRVVWTVHNLKPHERSYASAHRLVREAVRRTADALVVHSAYARARVNSELGYRGPVLVAPHGNYIGVYGSGEAAVAGLREQLELPPGGFVYLVFGHLRRYKRVPETIAAFRSLEDDGARLLIAGRPTAEEGERIARAARGDARIILRLGDVPDDQVAPLFALADATIFAYDEVFSSGALLLALSFGVPAVVPAVGSGVEIAPPPATVPFVEGSLRDALLAVREQSPTRRAAALAAAERQRWQDMAEILEQAYRGEPASADRGPADPGHAAAPELASVSAPRPPRGAGSGSCA